MSDSPVDPASDRPPRIMTKVGRLEELNGRGGLTGTLRDASGEMWLCLFREDHMHRLTAAWMRTVRVVGEAVVEPGKERTFNVHSIVIEDEEALDGIAQGHGAPFWESLALEELAERQGVAPVEDLDEISALWPVDDDPDALLAHILSERHARDQISEGENA